MPLQVSASAAASAGAVARAQPARATWRCWAARREAVTAAYCAVTAAPRDACRNSAAAQGRPSLPSSSASAPAMRLRQEHPQSSSPDHTDVLDSAQQKGPYVSGPPTCQVSLSRLMGVHPGFSRHDHSHSMKRLMCYACAAHLLSEGRALPSRQEVSSRHSAWPLRKSAAASCCAEACAGA